MEKNINLAKILNGKPVNTKLWSPLFGDVYISSICSEDTIIVVNHHAESSSFYNNGKYFNHPESEPLLFPSKEMRDWRKFSWKKGDVLVSNDNDSHIIFKGFSKDDYTTFEGKYWISVSKKRYISCLDMQNTQDYHIEDNKDVAQTYINTIEEKLGGKLNLETLEIEKKPEFNDGDIVTITFNWGEDIVYIFKSEDSNSYSYYAWLNGSIPTIIESSHPKSDIYTVRLSTEEEKQRLFDALAKKGKAWDAEKKQIVDLKPKVELKPFDKVLVKDNPYGSWEPALFWKKVDVKDLHPYMIIGGKRYRYCEPYEGNEHLLGTTNNV